MRTVWTKRLLEMFLLQSTHPKCTPRDWEFGTVHLENNAKWCNTCTRDILLFTFCRTSLIHFCFQCYSLLKYWSMSFCFRCINLSRKSFLLFWRIRDTVDSLTLTFHLFSIQLTYSIRVPGLLLWWAYRQNSYFWASVKVIFVFGGMTTRGLILCLPGFVGQACYSELYK